jgi:hypothetical protein
MRKIAVPIWASLGLLPLLALAGRASGQVTYSSPAYNNYGDNSTDITSVVVSNDSSNLYFTINLDPYANIGTSGTDDDYFADYEIGFQMNGGAGGQTAINGTYGLGNPANGNPYGSAVGISTGMNYAIGAYLNGPSYSGGAQLFSYSSVAGWNQVGSTASISEVTGQGNGSTPYASLSFGIPLSGLGLGSGGSFNFDVWTTYSGGQGAYDALDQTGAMSTAEPTPPYSGGSYDSATAPGSNFANTVYTVVVPEPASIGLVGLSGLALLARRRRK